MSISNYLFFTFLVFFSQTPDDTTLLKESWRHYYERGLRQYQVEMYPHAIDSMKKALLKKPDLYQAATVLSEIYEKQKKREDSLEYLELSLKINPRQGELLIRRGLAREFFCRYDEALKDFQAAHEVKPSAVALAHQVRLLYRAGNHEGAKKILKKSEGLGMEEAASLLTKARRASQAKDHGNAERLYREVLAISPALLSAHMEFYEMERRRKRYDSALEILKNLVFICPFHEEGHIHLAHLYFTRPVKGRRQRNLTLAIRHLRRAAELNPTNPHIYHTLSDIYTFMGKKDEARKAQEEGNRLENKSEENVR